MAGAAYALSANGGSAASDPQRKSLGLHSSSQTVAYGAMSPDVNLNDDVASPIDLRTTADAREWAATAMQKRPWREEFFQCFVTELRSLRLPQPLVLELGSGPGFLAYRILESVPGVQYTMLDFSPAMHELARERLGSLRGAVRQVVRDFKCARWSAGLGSYDAIITMQAVHELRHKKHAPGLHAAVRLLLRPNGRYLVCDHYIGPDGMTNEALFMSIAEQHVALGAAGFKTITCLLEKWGLVLFSAAAE
jgi:ubiquinone/menaquinone biosynthesis C-methylase UbiE